MSIAKTRFVCLVQHTPVRAMVVGNPGEFDPDKDFYHPIALITSRLGSFCHYLAEIRIRQ